MLTAKQPTYRINSIKPFAKLASNTPNAFDSIKKFV